MKISLDWINDYVNLQDIDVEWLTNKFTITTAEIEDVYHTGSDVIFEIDNKSLTNRPDLWCHYGIAREISAITGRKLKSIDYVEEEELKNISEKALNVSIEDREKCLRYSAIKIGNIKANMSPEIIATRLSKCGIRPINIVIDISNYVMLDIGQPLHTFDKKDIDSIRVASLKEPIKFKSLDTIERVLPIDTLIISSEDKPLAIAGIIGGEESAVSENTEGIVLESATFEGVAIRKTALAIGLRTDASARYEKFLDTAVTTVAIGRFLRLLQKYQPEIKLESSLYDNIINAVKDVNISIEHKYIETYLGTGINKETVIKILESLEFEVAQKDKMYNIKVPTFRATKDITCKADIIEEILRVYGYDNIKGSPYKADAACIKKNIAKDIEYSIKDTLVKKFNFNEVQSYSWYDNNWINKLGNEYKECLKIVNSSVKQFEKLRSDIVPNLLKIIYNNRKNYEEISIFEIGRVFLVKDGELTQPKHLTASIYSRKDEEEVYRYVKGICSYLLRSIKNIEARYIQVKDTNKEHCLSINYNNKKLGYIYSIPEATVGLISRKHVVNILDIDLEVVSDLERNEIKYQPIYKYPETYLDFSILTPMDMPYCDIGKLVSKFINELVIETKYIETYIGENIPKDMKSTTIRIVIGDINRTLQIEEINKVKELFIKHLNINGLNLRNIN
ncbi:MULTISPECIES: phenylalanine--tRNA ligase subunit beta [unclassified Clostridium]|uniref:phenylalanine--tRNA ligase subunit beta n=1 Tax=unclassified Clostridium TaxID=2614128 RepID=UPI0002976F7F|nr:MULTISPECIES: phenylalanine--tRNA ligase subunit beta [unclassified Clostridium]EKQ57978.1 MAG: phenylalanyl-tRNA synthetase, beta subunit [Clostridium sp. Maddingley MBC34-26]